MFKILLLLKTILCLTFELKPFEEESFEEKLKSGVLYKLQYSEKDGNDVVLNITDDKGREIGSWNTSYSVIHTRAEEDLKLNILFKNVTKKLVSVKLTVPDLDNEQTETSITKDNNVQSVAELEEKLKSIIEKTTEYIERMSSYTKKLAIYKWRIRCFMVLEIIFSMAMVYYLHRDTVGLFERRKRV